jgi:hypothetical protein
MFTTCANILIIIIKSNFGVFWSSSLNFKFATFRIEECDNLNTFKRSYKNNKIMFISLYKHHLPKISKFQNDLQKLKFEI